MGLAEILRVKHEKSDDSKEVDEKVLAQAVKQFVDESRNTEGYKDRLDLWEKMDTLYGQSDAAAVQIIQGNDGTDEFVLVPRMNQMSLTIDKVRDQFMDADQPPVAQAKRNAEMSDTDAIEALNSFLEDYREFCSWHDVSAERALALIKYGTVAIAVGFDKNKQYVGEIEREIIEPVESQEGQEEQASTEVSTPAGEPFFELLMPSQLAVDAECIKFEDSRTVVVERQKTRDALRAMFPDAADKIDEAVKRSSGNTNRSGTSSKADKPVKLWEVFVEPSASSDWFKKGLHAYCTDELVLFKEDASWHPGERPVIFYLMEPSQTVDLEKRTPWGYTKLQRIIPLQIALNDLIADMQMNARNDIPAPFYDESAIDPEVFTDNPGEPIPVHGLPTGRVMRLTHASNAPALIQMIQEVKAAIEEVSQVYSFKHGFKSGQRLATEIEALAEQQVRSYSEPIRNIRQSDKLTFRVFYAVCVKHNKISRNPETPLDIDFVISSDDIPMPRAIARQRIDADAAVGLMGPLEGPGILSVEAVIAVREARRKIGDDIINPMLDLHEKLADKLINSIKANVDPPFISRQWNVPMILHRLDTWAMEASDTGTMTPEQAIIYDRIRSELEVLAEEAKAEKLERMQDIQARLQARGQAFAQGAGLPQKVAVTGEQPITQEGVE